MKETKKQKKKGLIGRFVPYFKKYKWILVFDLFCAALTTVCELVLPMLVRFVTNAGINDLASLTLEIIVKIGVLPVPAAGGRGSQFFYGLYRPHYGHEN